MAEWIAFDDASVSALTRQTGQQVHLGVGDASEVALSAEGPALAILPPVQGLNQVITVRRTGQITPVSGQTAGTGFLGLIDTPMQQEPPQPKTSWWKKLLP